MNAGDPSRKWTDDDLRTVWHAATVSLLYHLTHILSFSPTCIASIYTEETDYEKCEVDVVPC